MSQSPPIDSSKPSQLEPGPLGSDESQHFESIRRHNSKLGLTLFASYLVLYLGFVLANAFMAHQMETPVIAGLNLAIVYGVGLIGVALLMALVYGAGCKNENHGNPPQTAKADSAASGDLPSNQPEANE